MAGNKLTFSDLKDICRLCLTGGRLIGIFEDVGQRRQIAYKIRVCLRVVIYAGDPLPQSICPACLARLDIVNEFRQKHLKNNRILANILFGVKEQFPEVAKFIKLAEDGMGALKPVISARTPVDSFPGGSIDGQDEMEWLPAGPPMLVPEEEPLQIFVQDGPNNAFLQEQDDSEPELVMDPLDPDPPERIIMDPPEAIQDQSIEPRSNEDNTEENPKVGTTAENTPTAECSSSVEEILGKIKQEPEEVEVQAEADEQEIVVTWLMQPADQEDVLDISRVKTEPVPLDMIKVEPAEPTAAPAELTAAPAELTAAPAELTAAPAELTSAPAEPTSAPAEPTAAPAEPIAVSAMANNTVGVKEEASTSSVQSRTRSRKINVECSKCFLVFHRETEILRHRCIGITPWYCEPCKKYYKTRETFSRHKRNNCPSKEHTCIPCGSVFSNKIQLAQHQVIHLRVKLIKLDVSKLNTCKTCLRTFSCKASLNMHERSHLNVNEKEHYLRSSESHNRAIPQSIEAHSGLLHSSNRNVPAQQCAKVSGKHKNQYHCTVCKAVFTNRKLFNAHNRQHGLKNPYGLKKQPVPFKTDRKKGQQERLQPPVLKLEATDKNYCSADIYACIICRESFDTQEALIEHKKLHTTAKSTFKTHPFSSFTMGNDTLPVSKWVCKLCGLDCRHSKVLWSHMHEKHSSILYKCNHCQKTFGKLCSLKSHEKIHKPKLRCTACGKQYSTLKALAAHEQKKHVPPTGTHLCRKCNIKFDSRSALLIHARNHQSLPRGKKSLVPVPSKPRGLHTCSVCEKTFTRYDSLKRHEKTHTTHKNTCYPCEICGSQFTSVLTYRAHTENHFQKMSKTHCRTCKQTFFSEDFDKHSCVKWQNLPSTSQVPVVKKFKCELCTAAFGTQQARNSHMRIHRKNWKYSTQRMENNTGMFQSMVQNSGNIPLPIYCPLCSKAFLSKDELRQHVRLFHPKK